MLSGTRERVSRNLGSGAHGANDIEEAFQNLSIHVQVQSNEPIDQALKRFNRQLQQSGILKELKEHAHYEKPRDRKRRRARRRRR